LRAQVERYVAAAARDPNSLRGYLLMAYARDLARLLAGPQGLQRVLQLWQRGPRCTVVAHSRHAPRRARKARSTRRGRAVDIPGVYGWR
jgi:hypothetical protein